MFITNSSIRRPVVLTDYIPIQARAEKECKAADYYSFRKGDTSLLELTFDQTDHVIHRITLLICADFCKEAEDYRLPTEYTKGDCLIDTPAEIDTNVFSCVIYRNAVKIIISALPGCKYVLSDNIVWELSEHGNMISVCLVDVTGRASEHCSLELSGNQ